MSTGYKIGRITAWLFIGAGVLLGIVGIINKATGIFKQEIDFEIYASFFVLYLSSALAYLIKNSEKAIEELESVNIITNTPPVTVFNSSEEFFEALLSKSLASDEVYTCMLSDPPANLGNYAVEYFDGMDKKISNNKKTFSNFRRIATVHSKRKAEWVLETLAKHKDNGIFCLAIQYIEDGYPQTSFHVAKSPKHQYLFIWATMASGGFGKGFMVQDADATGVMIEEHERSFIQSVVLKSGSELNMDKIEKMATKYDLLDSEAYKKLSSL